MCLVCEHRHPLGGSHTFPPDVTEPPEKLVTILPLVTKPAMLKKAGRPSIGKQAMTGAERVRRHRAAQRVLPPS